jgi:protein-S-isoprenylcysteine O-methyltransferase Ste14
VAVAYGLACHVAFALGVLAMIVGLHQGLRTGLGRLEGTAALVANAALVLQFPLLHSLLLSSAGSRFVARLAPLGLGRALATTTYGTLASLQVLVTFALWTPSGTVWWEATGPARVALDVAYAGSWLLVIKAMHDAGLGVQTGSLGWLAVARGQDPRYGPLPTQGLFRACRQPIYGAFALTLWTGAVWTPDRLALALTWTAYCLVGPLLKERRYARRFGRAFEVYRTQVPYMIPRRPRQVVR